MQPNATAFMNEGLSLMLAVAEIMQGGSSWGPERRKFTLNLKDESWSNCYIVIEKPIKKRYGQDPEREAG